MRLRTAAFGLCAIAFSLFAHAADKTEYRIGVVTATTGAASVIAAPALAAINLIEERVNADKSLPYTVKFIKYDDGSDPTKSVNAVRKLIQEDEAHVIICCSTTPSSLAIAKTVTEGATTAIAMAAAASVTEPQPEKAYMFKTPVTDRLMINYTLDRMVKKGVKTVAFMGLEDSYGEGAWVEFKPLAEKKGLVIVAKESFARGDTNFAPQALRAKNAKPDAVYFHAIPPSAALAHEALKRVGYAGPIYHGAGSPTPAFISIGKSAVEGAIVGAIPITVYKDLPATNPIVPVITQFVTEYEAKYGRGKAEIFATQAWDAANIALKAIERHHAAGKRASLAQVRTELRAQVENTRNFVGTHGIFNYSPTDHVGLDSRTTYLVVVKDGQFKLLPE